LHIVAQLLHIVGLQAAANCPSDFFQRLTRPSRSRALRRSRAGFGAVERGQGVQNGHAGTKTVFIQQGSEGIDDGVGRRVFVAAEFSQSAYGCVARLRRTSIGSIVNQDRYSAVVLECCQATADTAANHFIPRSLVARLLQGGEYALNTGFAEGCGGLGFDNLASA
jgi:hypothetical protein